MPLLVFLSLCAFAITCYGWGRLAYSLCYPGERLLHMYSVALGLVVLVVAGGTLNTVGAATAMSLSIAVYAGLALGVALIGKSVHAFQWRSLFTREMIPQWLVVLVIAGLGVFLAMTLFPTRAFNHHDDFLSYLPRLPQLRATGTLGGNPFELLGFTDFGVQSLLVAALMTWLPLEAAYAFDSVFCFLLGLALLVEIGTERGCSRLAIALAMTAYVLLNPQIVNISSVYSSTLLVLTLLTASRPVLYWLDRPTSPGRLALLCAPLGATLATLVAVKVTAAFFVAPFCAILLAGLLLKNLRKGAAIAFATAAAALVALAPWLLAYADKLDPGTWSSPVIPGPELAIYPNLAEAFRDRPGIYGGTRSDYLIAVAALLLSLVAAVLRLLRQPQDVDHLLNVAATAAGIAVFIGLAATTSNEAALRYAIPFLIAITPYTLLYHRSVLAWRGEDAVMWRRGFAVLTIALQIYLFTAFFGYGYERLKRLAQAGIAVSYPVSAQALAAMQVFLSDERRRYLLDVQSRIPAGATILSWVDTPFRLDFGRNRVWHLPHDATVAPWWKDVASGDELRQVLEARGIDYVMWQYRTPLFLSPQALRRQLQQRMWAPNRLTTQRLHNVLLAFQQLANSSDLVFNDGTTIVIALKPRP